MNDCGYGDKYPPSFYLSSFVYRQDDIEVFVLVSEKHLIGSVCDEREDSNPITGFVRGCRFGLIELGKRAEILQPKR